MLDPGWAEAGRGGTQVLLRVPLFDAPGMIPGISATASTAP